MRLGALLVVAACSAPAPHSARTPPPPPGPPAHEVLPEVPFAALDAAQRADFMKQKVVPAMKEVFVRHDATKYADFGCQTCHGPHEPYAMPNPALSRPTPSPWMEREVVPAMQELLGSPSAIRCETCHGPP
jgi:hypothetical protein